MANVKITRNEQEQKAVETGIKDGFLTVLFSIGSYAGVNLLTYALSLLPFLKTLNGGKWAWLEVPLALVLAAAIKGFDRKKHEDPSTASGLVKI